MPPPAAVPVTLTAERKTLKKRNRGAKTCWRDRLRAQIVLAAARGRGNARIVADLGVSGDTVRKWRDRFAGRGRAGLQDLPRSGRPRRITEADRAAVVALACQLPAATGVPLSRWTGPELAAQGRVSAAMSVTSLLRILAQNPVRPWQYQSWIYPRDPDLAAKATVILDLYQGFYQGERPRSGRRGPRSRTGCRRAGRCSWPGAWRAAPGCSETVTAISALRRPGRCDTGLVGVPPKGLSDIRSRPRAANTWPGPPGLAGDAREGHLLRAAGEGAARSHGFLPCLRLTCSPFPQPA